MQTLGQAPGEDGKQATLKYDKGGKGGRKIKMAKDAGSTCG